MKRHLLAIVLSTLTLASCSTDQQQGSQVLDAAPPSAPAGTSDVELYIEIVKAALPTAKEGDLRSEQCSFRNWAGIGEQGCGCKLYVNSGCWKNGQTTWKELTGEGSATQIVFRSVCTTASDKAMADLLGNVKNFGSECTLNGGTLLDGAVPKYYR